MSVARVLAWSAAPLGALLVEQTNVVFVYAIPGILATLIPIGFFFSPLGRADEYVQSKGVADAESAATRA